jgi:hypothetical protein
MLNTVSKVAITNIAIEWNFEVTSDNFSLHLNVTKSN